MFGLGARGCPDLRMRHMKEENAACKEVPNERAAKSVGRNQNLALRRKACVRVCATRPSEQWTCSLVILLTIDPVFPFISTT